MNESTNNQSDKARLETIMNLLSLNAHKLAVNIKVTPAAIYHIIGDDEKNGISKNLAEKIVKKYENVSYAYLVKGKGQPLLSTDSEIRAQKNMFLDPEDRRTIMDFQKQNNEGTDLTYIQLQEIIYQSRRQTELFEKLLSDFKEMKDFLSTKK